MHDVNPTGIRCTVRKCAREQLAVVKLGITFESVHRSPIFDGDFDQFGIDHTFTLRHKRREATAGIVKSAGYCAGGDADGVPAKAVIAFSGHQSSVYDEFDCFHLLTFLFLVKLFVIL